MSTPPKIEFNRIKIKVWIDSVDLDFHHDLNAYWFGMISVFLSKCWLQYVIFVEKGSLRAEYVSQSSAKSATRGNFRVR